MPDYPHSAVPTPECRAELRDEVETALRHPRPPNIPVEPATLAYFLDATEPVAEGEVALVLDAVRVSARNEEGACCTHTVTALTDAAALIERLARELAEVREAFPDYRRDPCNQPENMR